MIYGHGLKISYNVVYCLVLGLMFKVKDYG
jgi:hypothetical protein